MNKQILLVLAYILISNVTHAAILRCNKEATGPNIYATAQAAHDAAIAGDTIHLEPTSLGSYGQLAINKKIIIISTGDLIAQNPNTQANMNVGMCDDVYVTPGAEFSTLSLKSNGTIECSASNVNIVNCSSNSVFIINTYGGVSNILIAKCYMAIGLTVYDSYNDPTKAIHSIIVSNNFIGNYISIEGTYASTTISKNVIRLETYQSNVRNSTFNNNIIYRIDQLLFFLNSTGTNNIENQTLLFGLTGSNNTSNVDLSTVFLNWGNFNGDNYQLKPSYANQTVGMYAGSDPYRQACQPAVPAIYQLSIPTISNVNTLPIQVSTKSNN